MYVDKHVRKIIHSLELVDYLHVHAEKTWYNFFIPHSYISVDRAHHMICRAKVGKTGISTNIYWDGFYCKIHQAGVPRSSLNLNRKKLGSGWTKLTYQYILHTTKTQGLNSVIALLRDQRFETASTADNLMIITNIAYMRIHHLRAYHIRIKYWLQM